MGHELGCSFCGNPKNFVHKSHLRICTECAQILGVDNPLARRFIRDAANTMPHSNATERKRRHEMAKSATTRKIEAAKRRARPALLAYHAKEAEMGKATKLSESQASDLLFAAQDAAYATLKRGLERRLGKALVQYMHLSEFVDENLLMNETNNRFLPREVDEARALLRKYGSHPKRKSVASMAQRLTVVDAADRAAPAKRRAA